MKKPYFLWDYDFTDKQILKILKSGNEYSRQWMIGRILESAKFEDIWKYLHIKEILEIFPRLKLRPPIKQVWEKAFKAWGYY